MLLLLWLLLLQGWFDRAPARWRRRDGVRLLVRAGIAHKLQEPLEVTRTYPESGHRRRAKPAEDVYRWTTIVDNRLCDECAQSVFHRALIHRAGN